VSWFALSLAAAGTQATQFAVIKGRARDIPPVVIVAWTNAVAFTAWVVFFLNLPLRGDARLVRATARKGEQARPGMRRRPAEE